MRGAGGRDLMRLGSPYPELGLLSPNPQPHYPSSRSQVPSSCAFPTPSRARAPDRRVLGPLTLGHVHDAHGHSGHGIPEQPGPPAVVGQPTQRGQPRQQQAPRPRSGASAGPPPPLSAQPRQAGLREGLQLLLRVPEELLEPSLRERFPELGAQRELKVGGLS